MKAGMMTKARLDLGSHFIKMLLEFQGYRIRSLPVLPVHVHVLESS